MPKTSQTLTIRITDRQRRRLQEVAQQHGQTTSELVRQWIERGLEETSLGERLAHLKGSLPEPSTPADELAKQLRERNWRA